MGYRDKIVKKSNLWTIFLTCHCQVIHTAFLFFLLSSSFFLQTTPPPTAHFFLLQTHSTANGFFIFSLLLAGFFFLFLFLFFFLLQTQSTMFTDQTHKHKPTTMAENGFFIALNGSGLLNIGFSDLSLVNCLLGLDDDGVVGSLGWDF